MVLFPPRNQSMFISSFARQAKCKISSDTTHSTAYEYNQYCAFQYENRLIPRTITELSSSETETCKWDHAT